MSEQNNVRQHYNDDEIDLMELIKIVWTYKKLIIGITFLFTVSGIIYSLLATPIYKATSTLSPPALKDVQELIALRDAGVDTGLRSTRLEAARLEAAARVEAAHIGKDKEVNSIQPYSVDDVFNQFKANLSSKSLLRRFFNENKETILKNKIAGVEIELNAQFEIFSQLITVKEEKKSSITFVSLEWHDPKKAVELLNNYVQMVGQITIHQVANNMKESIKNNASLIEKRIEGKRDIAGKRLSDTIDMLTEAIEVAKILNIKKSMPALNAQKKDKDPSHYYGILSGLYAADTNSDSDRSVYMGVSPSLYYRGYEALEAEVKILKSRKSIDAFIPELRDLQGEISFLKSIKINEEDLKSVSIDQKASLPATMVIPKRKLIVSMSFAGGIMFGVMFVLIRHHIGDSESAGE